MDPDETLGGDAEATGEVDDSIPTDGDGQTDQSGDDVEGETMDAPIGAAGEGSLDLVERPTGVLDQEEDPDSDTEGDPPGDGGSSGADGDDNPDDADDGDADDSSDVGGGDDSGDMVEEQAPEGDSGGADDSGNSDDSGEESAADNDPPSGDENVPDGSGVAGPDMIGAAPEQADVDPLDAATPAAGGGTTNITVANATYPVTGTTLAEAADAIRGREEAGETTWSPTYTTSQADGKVSQCTVTVPITVTMPDWPGAGSLNAADKAKWDSFMAALTKHEQGHVDRVKSAFTGLGEKMVGQSPSAAKALFDGAMSGLKAASDSYDTSTNHGINEGVVIDD